MIDCGWEAGNSGCYGGWVGRWVGRRAGGGACTAAGWRGRAGRCAAGGAWLFRAPPHPVSMSLRLPHTSACFSPGGDQIKSEWWGWDRVQQGQQGHGSAAGCQLPSQAWAPVGAQSRGRMEAERCGPAHTLLPSPLHPASHTRPPPTARHRELQHARAAAGRARTHACLPTLTPCRPPSSLHYCVCWASPELGVPPWSAGGPSRLPLPGHQQLLPHRRASEALQGWVGLGSWGGRGAGGQGGRGAGGGGAQARKRRGCPGLPWVSPPLPRVGPCSCHSRCGALTLLPDQRSLAARRPPHPSRRPLPAPPPPPRPLNIPRALALPRRPLGAGGGRGGGPEGGPADQGAHGGVK